MGDAARLEELEAELMDLYTTLDERDQRIAELESGGAPTPRGGALKDDDIVKITEER